MLSTPGNEGGNKGVSIQLKPRSLWAFFAVGDEDGGAGKETGMVEEAAPVDATTTASEADVA